MEESMTPTTSEELINGYRVHPAAAVFPLIDGDEFEELCASIKKHGVQHPAIVRGDELIDGRNRMRAVERLLSEGWSGKCPVTEWIDDGRNVAEWVWDTNALRRHMSEDGLVYASAAIWPLIAKENEAKKEATQFKKGASGNPDGKKQVTTESLSPAKRDRKKSNAACTAGQVARNGKTSLHKARQAIAVQKAVASGELPPEAANDLMTGKKKLRQLAPKKARAKKPKPARTMSVILQDLRDLIAEWKNADHNVEVLRDELKTQIERT
jgi:hypothetical protein